MNESEEARCWHLLIKVLVQLKNRFGKILRKNVKIIINRRVKTLAPLASYLTISDSRYVAQSHENFLLYFVGMNSLFLRHIVYQKSNEGCG